MHANTTFLAILVTTESTQVLISDAYKEEIYTGEINPTIREYTCKNGHNIAIGQNAVAYQSSGTHNIMVGRGAGMGLSGEANLSLGRDTGRSLNGSDNIIIGDGSGYYLSGSDNIALGEDCASNLKGSDNTMMGEGNSF